MLKVNRDGTGSIIGMPFFLSMFHINSLLPEVKTSLTQFKVSFSKDKLNDKSSLEWKSNKGF
jgi:hypothetical protein